MKYKTTKLIFAILMVTFCCLKNIAIAQSDTSGLLCYVSLDKDDNAVNQDLMKFLKTKFSQKDCNSCIQRYVDDKPWVEEKTTYDGYGNAINVDQEDFTKHNVTFRNKCQKGVRVLGIYKEKAINGTRQYGIIWKSYPANFNGDYSRSSNDPMGGVFSDLLFGGGETTDLDLSYVGHPYNNAAASPGSIEWLRIIEENETSQSKTGANGEQTIEVNSYTKTTTIKVKKGDKIYLQASGLVTTGMWSGASGPNGKVYTPLWNIEPAINYGALMLKIGNGDYIATSTDTTIIAPNGGILSFAVNDKDPTDNSGSFTVVCSINKPLPQRRNEIITTEQQARSTNSNFHGDSRTHGTSVQSYDLKSHLPKKFKGTVTSRTTNKISICEVTLLLADNGKFELSGLTTDENLKGSWVLTGVKVNDNNHSSYEFVGELETKVSTSYKLNANFGQSHLNNIPFKKKAKIPMTWTVEMIEDGISGQYNLSATQDTKADYGVISLH
jgi:hypothetical protein